MKSIFKLGLAVSAVVAVSGNGWAEDYDWSGPYVGVSAGYGFGHQDTFLGADWQTPGVFERDNGTPDHLDPKGFIGGAYAGYNFNVDPFVMGFEIDGSLSNMSGAGKDTAEFPLNPNINGLQSDLNGLGTARVRLGIANGQFLMYATGGLAIGATQDTYTYDNPPNGWHDRWGKNSTSVGYALGAGLEYAMSETVSIRAEYMHVNLGNTSFNPSDIAGGAVYGTRDDGVTDAIVKASFDHNYDIVRMGLTLKF